MEDLRDPWLAAAWPGMGMVAQLAASYLAQALGARPMVEMAVGEHFGATGIEVRDGVLQPLRRPRTLLLEARIPDAPRDLVVLLAESQPAIGERRYCEQVLVKARETGISRVFTFAALATTAPAREPRVFAASTDPGALEALVAHGAEALHEGEIGGMNGYFLGVAAELGIGATALVGEIPFFATNVQNPRAAAAVLRVFTRLCGCSIDLDPLERKGHELEHQFQALRHHAEGWLPSRGELTRDEELRLEALFQEARLDRSRATQLKQELDRLGVFERFEDRFLDLFKRGG